MKILATLALAAATLLAMPAHAVLVADYQLNGTLADALGGADITNNGGTLGAAGISFGANEGPSLGGFASTGVYSIETRFRFDDVSGYRKILDFQALASDTGLYNLGSSLNFYPITTGAAGAFAPNVMSTVLFTRDAAGDAKGYVDGILQISFNDGGNLAVIPSVLTFFTDDNATAGEYSPGFVDFIRIYDTAIVPGAVPEPASWALMIGGFGMIGAALRRRRTAIA